MIQPAGQTSRIHEADLGELAGAQAAGGRAEEHAPCAAAGKRAAPFANHELSAGRPCLRRAIGEMRAWRGVTQIEVAVTG